MCSAYSDPASRQLLYLRIERLDGLFEHPAMRRCGGAVEVGLRPGTGELQRVMTFSCLFLGWAQFPTGWAPRALGFFLLGFDLFRFESASHW